MNIQLANSKSSMTIWQHLHTIDKLLASHLPLTTRLEKINPVLIKILDIDAVWFLTINPLPSTACGLMRTPLRIAPDAQISITDTAPSIETIQAMPDTPLKQTLVTQTPFFREVNDPDNPQTDIDLSDTLVNTFHLTVVAILPLVVDGISLGVLIIGNHKTTETIELSPETQSMLTYLGKHLGQNLQNSFLVERSERYTEVLRTLNQIAQTITSSLNLDDVIQKTMAGINTILDVEAGSLLLLDHETDELYFKITLRDDHKQVASYRLDKNEGLAGWVIEHNQAAIVNDPAIDKRFSPKIDIATGFTTNTLLCAPLIAQGKPIGVLEVLNKRTGPFNEDDQELLVSMTAALGIALQNITLYEAVQERANINEGINEITAAINAGQSLSEMAKIIFRQFENLFTFDHISISLLDQNKKNVRQWTFGDFGSIEQTKNITPFYKSKLAQVIEFGHGYIEDNASKAKLGPKLYPDDRIIVLDRVESKIIVPLMMQQIPYGSLTLGSRQVNAYHIKDLRLLEQLAPQITIAIDKALLIDAMEQRTTELQLLNRLGEMLVSTTKIDVIVDTTLNMLPRLLPGDVQGVIIAAEEGSYAGVAVPYRFKQTKAIIQRIFEIFLEIREDDDALTELISSKSVAGNMPVSDKWQPVTVLSLPILTSRGTRGIIYMASDNEEILGDDLLRIFSLIVSQISSAVENARLFQLVEQDRARLAAILASITDAVLVVDRSGRIVLDNPAAWRMLGARESQRGHLLSESTRLETLINLFEDAIQGDQLTGEVFLEDGRTFFANLSSVSVGAITIGWVATMQDVSHFKELDQLKDDFVGAVSHDLRSPLGGILIAANLVPQSGETNEHQQVLLDLIEDRVETMSGLIDNLLDVGKIEAGIDMDLELCDIGAIISKVTSNLMPQAKVKEIELSCDVPQDLPPVLANDTRISQVFYNLITNAIKYTPNEGQVKVQAYPQGNELRIQVSDTGMGIPVSDQPHIFEKFYRVRGDHVMGIKGTGLGLAITKGIIEKHNGRIWLESVFGEGSTFTVTLFIHNSL